MGQICEAASDKCYQVHFGWNKPLLHVHFNCRYSGNYLATNDDIVEKELSSQGKIRGLLFLTVSTQKQCIQTVCTHSGDTVLMKATI